MQIKLKNISMQFPTSNKQLFAFKELSIPFKQKLLIKGPSGRGKSTLLHLIAGLMIPTVGDVFADEENLAHYSEKQRAEFRKNKISIVFQNLNLIDHLSLIENIQLGSAIQKETCIEALNSVGLGSRSNEMASVLSLGEKQRCAVARVLSRRMPLVLADEPTSSLDRVHTDQVMRSLIEATHESTLIAVSHDERIYQYFDKILDFEELIQ